MDDFCVCNTLMGTDDIAFFYKYSTNKMGYDRIYKHVSSINQRFKEVG